MRREQQFVLTFRGNAKLLLYSINSSGFSILIKTIILLIQAASLQFMVHFHEMGIRMVKPAVLPNVLIENFFMLEIRVL